MSFPSINSSTYYQSPVSSTQSIPNYGSVDGALVLMQLTSSSSVSTVTAAIDAAFSTAGYTKVSSVSPGDYVAVYAKVHRTSNPGTAIVFNAGTNVTIGVTQIQVTNWFGALAGVSAQGGVSSGAVASLDPANHVAPWGSADSLWIASAVRGNTLANNTLTGSPAGYLFLLSHGPSLTSGDSQWVYYKTAASAADNPSAFAWSTSRVASTFTIVVRPPANRYLRAYAYDAAAGATNIKGAVFYPPTGTDIVGAKIGEFTGAAFEETLENGLAVIKVLLSEFNGEALLTTDTPVVLLRNDFDTTSIIDASIIEA